MDEDKWAYRSDRVQLVSFAGFNLPRGSPTDIDCFIEFGDKVFIFIETKFKTAEVPFGQETALTRLVDVVGKEKKALLIISEHEDEGPSIDLKNSIVRCYRSRGVWFTPDQPKTVKQLVDEFLRYCKDF